MKTRSVELLRERAAAAGLANTCGVIGTIQDYAQPFDVALGLHACGSATDHAMQKVSCPHLRKPFDAPPSLSLFLSLPARAWVCAWFVAREVREWGGNRGGGCGGRIQREAVIRIRFAARTERYLQ